MTNRTKFKTCRLKKSQNLKIYLISGNRLVAKRKYFHNSFTNSVEFQEALDRLTVIKHTQQQLDQVKLENKHLRQMEAQREEIEVGLYD